MPLLRSSSQASLTCGSAAGADDYMHHVFASLALVGEERWEAWRPLAKDLHPGARNLKPSLPQPLCCDHVAPHPLSALP